MKKRISKTKIKLAHKEVLAHWKRLATGKRLPYEKHYAKNCAFCALFYLPVEMSIDAVCAECPVKLKTGKKFCRETPWDDCNNNFSNYPKYHSSEFLKAANRMYEFLKSIKI